MVPMLLAQAQQNQDNVMWEENRLLQSGVVRRTSVNEEEEKDMVRVQIIVMDIKPPFLDGRMVPAQPHCRAPCAPYRLMRVALSARDAWRCRCTPGVRSRRILSKIPLETCPKFQ
jgi:hypothetical protein